jgi:DnaJ-class molecular chaperone
MNPSDPYTVLGIDRDANESEIKAAYRRQALANHPDKNANDPDAPRRFRLVNEVKIYRCCCCCRRRLLLFTFFDFVY